MGQERNRQNAMRLLSGALGAHFCLIFSLSFLRSLFHRFFLDFGEVSGGFLEPKMVLKSKILFLFCICLWRFYFWSNFATFLIKSMAENRGIFNGFSTRRFTNCLLNPLISSMLET